MAYMMNDLERIEQHFGKLASLIGERSRAIMLWNLLDGRVYTATELAVCADISAQSASNHLAKLIEADLLTTENQGRHKYYRFKNEKVAQVIESIASLLPVAETKNENKASKGVMYARTCYDHLAGKTGVAITIALIQKKILLQQDHHFIVPKKGKQWFATIGIEVDLVSQAKRKFAFPCLDWSERKHHLGGALGAALLDTFSQKDWIRRIKQSREIIFTGTGRKELSKMLEIEI